MYNMLSSILFLIFISIGGAKADEPTVQKWIDLFIDLCVGSGSSYNTTVSGSITNTGIALESLTLEGSLKGEVVLARQQSKLLSDGLNNSMSEIEAEEADKVRDCLEPVRRQLLLADTSPDRDLEILSPDEDKIIRALVTTVGTKGEVGEVVPVSTIMEVTGLGRLHIRSALRSLEERGFANPYRGLEGGDVTISDAGEEYALVMNYAD